MANGITLELRKTPKRRRIVLPGTECSVLIRDNKVVGRRTCMPYVGASRDRSLPGKARIRARKAARR